MWRLIKDFFLIFLPLALLVVMAYFVFGGEGLKSIFFVSEKPALVSVGDAFFDFGLVSASDRHLRHEFLARNTGREIITVSDIWPACDCVSAELEIGGKKFGPFKRTRPLDEAGNDLRLPVQPGETLKILADFSPAITPEIIGAISHKIFIVYNGTAHLEFVVRGRVKP